MENAIPDLLVFKKLLGFHVHVLGLCAPRWFGFFFIFPIMIWAQVPPMLTLLWAVIFSLPLLPGMTAALSESTMYVWPNTSPDAINNMASVLESKSTTFIALKEFIIGVMLGLFPATFFFGFILVGEIADQARGDIGGKSAGGGPLSMTSTGTILFITGSALFLTTGEFFHVIQLFMKSYEIWPVFELENFLTREKIYFFLELSLKMLFSTTYMAVPFVVLMWSYDIQTAFQARTDKKFQGQEYQFALKNFTFMAFFIIYLKTTTLAQYNPTLTISTNFAILLEAGGHGEMHGR